MEVEAEEVEKGARRKTWKGEEERRARRTLWKRMQSWEEEHPARRGSLPDERCTVSRRLEKFAMDRV